MEYAMTIIMCWYQWQEPECRHPVLNRGKKSIWCSFIAWLFD